LLHSGLGAPDRQRAGTKKPATGPARGGAQPFLQRISPFII
jgi:hypothetical protein